MELGLFLIVLLVVVTWVTSPVRRPQTATPAGGDPALADEAHSRLVDLRDAELDAATGKLTADEHRRLDEQLRREALAARRRAQEAQER